MVKVTSRRRAAAVVIALVVATVACGGEDEESSDAAMTVAAGTEADTAADTTSAPASSSPGSADESTRGSTAESDSTTAAGPATGEPVKVMVIAPTDNSVLTVDELPVAVEAAAAHLNERGGAGGRPIETIYCNDRNDPNEAGQCARQAVDEGVVAVVGSASLNMSSSVIPVLEANDIPLINPQIYGPLEATSPNSFLLTGQFIACYAAIGEVLAARGIETAAFVHPDIAAAAAVNDNVVQSLEANGIELAQDIAMPVDAADVSSFVQQAIDADADAIVVTPAAAQTALVVDGLRSAGLDFSETTVVSYASTLNDLTLAQLGADGLDGIVTCGTYSPPTDPSMADFIAAMDEADPDNELTRSETSPAAWAGMMLLAEVAGTIEGDITAESLLAALNESGPVDVGLGLPPYDPSASNTVRPEFARVSNDGIFIYELMEAEWVASEPTFIEHAFKAS